MTATAEQYRAYRGHALFSMGFRPFFLAGAVWAALAAPIWALSFLGLAPAPFASRDWHVHEMLFGYIGAVIAGFLLTAVPNWTGRLPVTGAPLAALFALWLAGRAAMLTGAALGPLAPIVDASFLIVLDLVIVREVMAGRNLRNLPVCVLVGILAGANIATHLRAFHPELGLLGERAAIAVVAMLVALIGGRIVPSFTRNWMAKRGVAPEPAAQGRLDLVALAATAAALALWAAARDLAASGAALIVAGLLLFARLARWRGWSTGEEPLVLILHLGYAWLAAGLVLLGLGALFPAHIAPSAGVHALAAGAFGVMTLAVMTRASLGHTGRALTADRPTQAIYLLVNLGAALRVSAALEPAAYAPLLGAAALAWSGAFALFSFAYGPLLTRPRASSG